MRQTSQRDKNPKFGTKVGNRNYEVIAAHVWGNLGEIGNDNSQQEKIRSKIQPKIH